MKKICIIFVFLGLSFSSKARDYISYYLVHVGVDHTLKEHERQKDIKNQQAVVGVLEETNKTETNKLKNTYDKIISRLSKLGLAIDAAFMVQEAYPMLSQLIETQSKVIDVVSDHPQLLPLAIENERFIVEKGRSLVNYMTGLFLSVGDLNQMKAGDRKLLLSHALNELSSLNGMSWKMLSVMRGRLLADKLKQMRTLAWVNREKNLIGDIIENATRL